MTDRLLPRGRRDGDTRTVVEIAREIAEKHKGTLALLAQAEREETASSPLHAVAD